MIGMRTEMRYVDVRIRDGNSIQEGSIREDVLFRTLVNALSCGARYASAKITYDGVTSECGCEELNAQACAMRTQYRHAYSMPFRTWAEDRAKQMMADVGLVD